ncbi:MAG: DUF4125 family protein [Lachnospiraceae bacterium]|nr:DUF4125 family protein [Lachnospiraceae bacterium]
MKDELIEKIIAIEWKQFDRVNNEGGRASCQDNWPTFHIMRKSQFDNWNEEMLESYYRDVTKAEEEGWNLLTEKYARMMESTDPAGYAQLKDRLPSRSPERLKEQDEVVEIQVSWMEAFASKYPKVAGNARSIRKDSDSMYNTSYETYLRGELSTYSDETFRLYRDYIFDLQNRDKNLAMDIIARSANMYGYKGLDEAENSSI